MSRINVEELRALMKNPKETVQASTDVKAPEFELDDDGEEYMPVGTKGLLAASQKLLAINQGLTEEDERDSLQYQKVFRVNSMVREGIKMDAGKVARTAMYRAAKRKNLQGLEPGCFSSYVDRVLVGNPLTTPLEEINPMHLVENARRISRMGPGGLKSEESITEEAQSVHPSQFGFISSIEGPESARAGIDVRVAYGARLGSDGRLYQKFYDRRAKKHRWMSAQDIAGLTVKLPD